MKRILSVVAMAIFAGGLSGVALGADKLNVNTAAEADLMKLPEMTEARAKAIISYRKSTGELIQREELELIPQVKPIYPKIKDLVVVE
jgi:DNA uptake protein ComE-like DNA-binding protein